MYAEYIPVRVCSASSKVFIASDSWIASAGSFSRQDERPRTTAVTAAILAIIIYVFFIISITLEHQVKTESKLTRHRILRRIKIAGSFWIQT